MIQKFAPNLSKQDLKNYIHHHGLTVLECGQLFSFLRAINLSYKLTTMMEEDLIETVAPYIAEIFPQSEQQKEWQGVITDNLKIFSRHISSDLSFWVAQITHILNSPPNPQMRTINRQSVMLGIGRGDNVIFFKELLSQNTILKDFLLTSQTKYILATDGAHRSLQALFDNCDNPLSNEEADHLLFEAIEHYKNKDTIICIFEDCLNKNANCSQDLKVNYAWPINAELRFLLKNRSLKDTTDLCQTVLKYISPVVKRFDVEFVLSCYFEDIVSEVVPFVLHNLTPAMKQLFALPILDNHRLAFIESVLDDWQKRIIESPKLQNSSRHLDILGHFLSFLSQEELEGLCKSPSLTPFFYHLKNTSYLFAHILRQETKNLQKTSIYQPLKKM